MSSSISGILSAVAGLALVGGGWCLGYVIASQLIPADSATATRLSAATVVASAAFYGLFAMLLAAGRFELPIALPVILVGAVGACRWLGGKSWRLARSDYGRICALMRSSVRNPGAILVAACLVVVAGRIMRGLVAPPLAWDALTYHLFKAGRWVQQGADLIQPAPDAWGYYEYFPSAGESYWAWAMLAARDGAFLAPAGLLIWGGIVLAGYACARELGARHEYAIWCGLSIAMTPAVVNAITATYVDNTTLMFFLFGVLFTFHALAAGAAADALLSGLALGLATDVKLPMMAILVVAGLFLIQRIGTQMEAVLAAICFSAAGVVLLLVEYARVWLDRGLFYPFGLSIPAIGTWPGSEEVQLLHSGRLTSPLPHPNLVLLRSLIWPGWTADYLGLGPVAPILFVIGAAVWIKLALTRDRNRDALFFVPVAALLLFAELISPDIAALRTFWPGLFARFVMPLFALIAIFAAVPRRREWRAIWMLALVVDLALAIPWAWRALDVSAVLALGAAMLAGIAIAAAILLLLRSRLRFPAIAALAALAILVPVAATLPRMRARLRYRFYAAAASESPVYDLHPLEAGLAKSWRAWQFLDDGAPHRVGVAAGWDLIGQNWYLYPLLGSRLQNRVFYIPITTDGSVIDYRRFADLVPRVDFQAWLARLKREQIEYFVTLVPRPPELGWIKDSPQLFTPVLSNGAWQTTVWAFHPPPAP